MKIEQVRIFTTKGTGTSPGYTISHIYVNGEYVCDSVEDYDRGLYQGMTDKEIAKIKVRKQTAIPVGTYDLTMNVISPKFSQMEYYKKYCKGRMPRLQKVPGFEGILIHRGSSANSSAGCIIVGYNTVKGKVTSSQKAWELLMKQYFLPAWKLGEKMTYTITRRYKV